MRDCNGDARPNLDGAAFEQWSELWATFSALPLHERISALNFVRELSRGGESARTIGLGEALAEVDKVIALNQGKHSGHKWRTQSAKYHNGKMLKHLGAWLAGELTDPESKRSHLAHVVARALMLAGIALEEDKRR